MGQLRIIGGQWRGRKFVVPDLSGLRPTPDRVRETLFNWLSQSIPHSRCLDLFAGSGALGLEALSRGAEHVVFVDNQAAVKQHLQTVLTTLDCDHYDIIIADASQPLALPDQSIDVVFLDPPFHQGLLASCCQWLEASNLLSPDAYIYIEAEKNLTTLCLPDNWQIKKSKQAGQVAYYLIQRLTDSETH